MTADPIGGDTQHRSERVGRANTDKHLEGNIQRMIGSFNFDFARIFSFNANVQDRMSIAQKLSWYIALV